MKYIDILSSVPSFQKLVKQDLPLPISYKLMKLIRKINEELEFYKMKEGEINQKCRDQNLRDDERVAKIAELQSYEIDWDFEPMKLKLSDSILLSCSDIDALSQFIEFVE